jgi:ribonuclease BN (tRNA processing enzyme)
MKSLKFLGTAGARFAMLRQLRASGGLWLKWKDTNLLIDPGPGSLVRALKSRPKLNPADLDGIILTHRHLDHSGDINVMIEAMTEGGHKKRGVLFAPHDALEDDPVILKYNRNFVDKIEILKENSTYKIKDVVFEAAAEHIHGCQAYGLNFKDGKKVLLSFITDTQYFKGIEREYPGDVLIANILLFEKKEHILHLSLDDARTILRNSDCRVFIMTHFGLTMIKNKPHELALKLQKEFKDKKIIAAYDGMTFDFNKI